MTEAPPISTFIVKATSFCNLNCKYCYMFNLGDTTYRKRPPVMPPEVVNAFAIRLAEYISRFPLKTVHIVLHGGEPLLAGKQWVRDFVHAVSAAGDKDLQYDFSLQTNGVLLDPEWIDLLSAAKIRVGLSLDGPPEIHDLMRRNHANNGSYKEVIRGLRLLAGGPAHLFGGVLCVINPAVSGLQVYKHFLDLGIRRMDFLFPEDFNWDHPPARNGSESTPFADYLIPIFDQWWQGDQTNIEIRLFKQLITMILGGKSSVDSLGAAALAEAVIEADGSIEPLDVLRVSGDGFTELGLNVRIDPIASLLDQPLFQFGLLGEKGLCVQCKSCSLSDICGGGYLPSRYSTERMFDNPSVYCIDMWKLITHIIKAVRLRIATSVQTGLPVSPKNGVYSSMAQRP